MAWQALMQIHAQVLAATEVQLRRRHDLSVSEFDALVHLPPTGGLRHQQLADRVILTRTALTRMIDRLAARGLLTREPATTDRRGVRICLTEQGRRTRRGAVRTNNQVVRQVFGNRLDPTDAEVLVRIRHRLCP